MLSDHIAAAMTQASYRQLPEDDSWFGHIPSLDGVWANAETAEACAIELREVLEEWIALRLAHNLPIAPVDGQTVAVRDVA
jgi:predicted RNase H-like HicB family nuclease